MSIESVLFPIWVAVQAVIGVHLMFPLFLYGLSKIGIGRKALMVQPATRVGDYAIIVTAYEQTDMLPNVVTSLLALKHQNYIIYVVADNCDVSSLSFDDDKVVLLRPESVLKSNVRSHFYAINRFVRQHDRLTIIDSDNLVDPEYLNELDRSFSQGFKAVQGVRMAKNLDSMYANLDAARDLYYHFYDGRVLFDAGSSATLAGSGMAFTVGLYKDCFEKLDVEGAGFDKILQYKIVSRGERICYNEHAIVFDQKTSHADQLVKQRARWINTWFRYFSFGFSLVLLGLSKRNTNALLFGIVLLRPPLFVFLILSLTFFAIELFLGGWGWMAWAMGFSLFIVGFFLALHESRADGKIYRSLINIPVFMFYQVIALIKSRKANAISVATRHRKHEYH